MCFRSPRIRIAIARRQRDAFGAAADGGVGAFVDDLVRGNGDGLQAGGAESIDGGAATVTGRPARIAATRATFISLRAVRLRAAENHVLDFGRIELRRFAQNVFDAVRGQIVRPGHIEGSAERFRKASPRAGDNDSFSHREYGLRIATGIEDDKQRDPQQAEEVPIVGDDVDQFAAFGFSQHDDKEGDQSADQMGGVQSGEEIEKRAVRILGEKRALA